MYQNQYGYGPTPPPPQQYGYCSQQQQYDPNTYQPQQQYGPGTYQPQQQYGPGTYQPQQQYGPGTYQPQQQYGTNTYQQQYDTNTYQQQQGYYYQQQQQPPPAPPLTDHPKDSQEPPAATQQDPPDHSPAQEPPPPGTVDEAAKVVAPKPPDEQETKKEETSTANDTSLTGGGEQKVQPSVDSSAQVPQWTAQNQWPQQQQQNYQQNGYQQNYQQGYPPTSTWQSQGQGDPNAYQWGQYQWGAQGWQQQQQAPQQWSGGGVEAWAGQQWSQPQTWNGAQQNQGGSYSQPTQAGAQGSWQQRDQPYSYQQPAVGYQSSQSAFQPPPQQPPGEPSVSPGYGHPPSGARPGEERKQPLLPTPPQPPAPEGRTGGHDRPGGTPPGRKRKRGSRWDAPEKQDPPPRRTPPKEQGPPPKRPYTSVPPPTHTPTRHSPIPQPSPTPPTPPILEDRTPTPPPLPDQPRSSAPDTWPPRLQHYIARAFGACTPGDSKQKDSVERFLREELHVIFEEKREWQINWDTYPLPMDRDYQEHCVKRKRDSRWDTPSPGADMKSMPLPPQLPHHPLEDGGAEEGGRGMPAMRGKRRRKNKKKGKGKFFLDNQPDAGFVMSAEDRQKIDQRAQRFGKGSEGNRNFRKKLSINELVKVVNGGNLDESEINWQDFAIEGTSEALEKSYLRLTSAPDPSTVRPEKVLKLSLEHVKGKWKTGKDYRYICEQFKSIRQDLTIQGIRNNFTVEVYETHGRVAVENGDREEFNQCQTQLKALYSEGIPGNIAEFVAYRILYLILTNSSADMSSVLKELEPGLSSEPCVDHALRLRSSWALGNYHRFFQLYRSAPNTGGSLMDMFVERERKTALKAMAKAYRPNMKVEYVSQELGFTSLEDCLAFLSSVGAVLDSTGTLLDCKLTTGKIV